MEPSLVDTPYRLEAVLGTGTSTKVFSATDTRTGKGVAVKWAETPHSAQLLKKEAAVMRDLKRCKAVPRLLAFSPNHQYIVMKRVGKTLFKLRETLGSFSLQTICLVGTRCISALEEVHTCGYVHRDIKPDNITASLSPSSARLYLIDFGLSSKYISKGVHVKYSETEKFQGAPYFCTLNSLKGVKSTRRDDMEAVGFMLLYLKKGNLPWMQEPNVSRIEKARERVSLEQLCAGEHPVFSEYLQYCQGLRFEEKPSYDYLRNLLQQTARRLDIDLASALPDWSPSKSSLVRSHSRRHRSRHRQTVTLSHTPVHCSLPGKAVSCLQLTCLLPCKSIGLMSTNDESGSEAVTYRATVKELPCVPWPRKGAFSSLLKSA